MSDFIGYTVGLRAIHAGVTKLVRVEYTRRDNGTVFLAVVSGHNLARVGNGLVVSALQYAERSNDPLDGVQEARWALGQCGWSCDFDDDADVVDR